MNRSETRLIFMATPSLTDWASLGALRWFRQRPCGRRHRNLGGTPELRTAMWWRNRRAIGSVFVELVAQGADRDTENIRGMRPITETMLERLKNEIPLDFGNRTANQIAGDLVGSHGSLGRNIRPACLIEPPAVR